MIGKSKEKAVKPKKDSAAPISPELYRTLLAPVVTEKSTSATAHNRVTFRVPLDATKPQIRDAVQSVFKVDVIGVNTQVCKGKSKRFRGKSFTRSDWKKAVVRLKDGQSIDLTAKI